MSNVYSIKRGDKIDAIKKLRELTTVKGVPEINRNVAGEYVVKAGAGLGLKEAKDFVESVIEAFVLPQAPVDVWELRRISLMDGAVEIVSQRIGLFATEEKALLKRDSVMRHRRDGEVYETTYDFSITRIVVG